MLQKNAPTAGEGDDVEDYQSPGSRRSIAGIHCRSSSYSAVAWPTCATADRSGAPPVHPTCVITGGRRRNYLFIDAQNMSSAALLTSPRDWWPSRPCQTADRISASAAPSTAQGSRHLGWSI
jgi:hypothetical protein